MTTVFIAGSISISRLHEMVRERIGNIVSADFDVVVGDADGADASIQACLHDYMARKVTVYCTGETPRNNIAGWPVHSVESKARAGTRAFFMAKDLEMARNSDYGLMIWDSKSTGTLSNVIELLREKKKCVVFVNKDKDFVTVGGKADLDRLLRCMSDHARTKAEEKIGLSAKIALLDQASLPLDPTSLATVEASPKDRPHLPPALSPNASRENENMKLRAILMAELSDYIARTHMSQSAAAKVFGVTQPRISDLTRGKVDVFGLDTLVNMASMAGLHVEMLVSEKNSDSSLPKAS